MTRRSIAPYEFSFDGTDGRFPNGLVFGSEGLLHGTTGSGGISGFGTLFMPRLLFPPAMLCPPYKSRRM